MQRPDISLSRQQLPRTGARKERICEILAYQKSSDVDSIERMYFQAYRLLKI